MNELLDAFQRRHREKLSQLKHREDEDAFLDGVRILIADLQQAGASAADPTERSQLRALMRFWGGVAHDLTGVYPDITLLPLDPAHARPPEEPARRSPPPPIWMLVGGAAAIVIAAGLVAIGWLSGSDNGVAAPPTPAPTSPVEYATVEVMLGEGGAVVDTFCLGTAEIAAKFTLEGVQPETVWYWELQREGKVVAAQPEAPWGRGVDSITAHVLGGGPGGVEPGRYDLLVYAGERVVGARSFQVLDVAPRVFDLHIADMPWSAGEAPSAGELDAGVRVLYLSYGHEGSCPGLKIAHILYHEGVPMQENVETWWASVFQGQRLISIQALDGQPFPAGSYELVVIVAGEEQARLAFTVAGEEEEEEEKEAGPPAFGEITLAQSVQPDGTPILTAPDDRFDWNTKAIYAIFDYTGMSDGVRWAAVWTYGGREITRQEGVWDVEAFGTEGTSWVVYYDEDRWTLAGGRYSVTLYVEGIARRTADFEIRYPPGE